MRYLVFFILVFFSLGSTAQTDEISIIALYGIAMDAGLFLNKTKVKNSKKDSEVDLTIFIKTEGVLDDYIIFFDRLKSNGFLLGSELHFKVKKNGAIGCAMELYKLSDSG
jgi:hypothetical protein